MNHSLLKAIQPHVTNDLSKFDLRPNTKVAAILGVTASTTAKSPKLWNPVFQSLSMDTAYIGLDVTFPQLPSLVKALRDNPLYIGGNITMPYKIAVMECLDEVDPTARHIGAVNTIARTSDGKLKGYNTDGRGAIESLRKSGMTLKNAQVLFIGAGGAARSVAFHLLPEIGANGRLFLLNRDTEKARQFSRELNQVSPITEAISLEMLSEYLRKTTLLVNCSTVGQAGVMVQEGKTTFLEPFSPLASTAQETEGALPQWFERNVFAISSNNTKSLELMTSLRSDAAVFDIIHTPQETTLLRHARWSGRPTLNGKEMNIYQAVEGFFLLNPTQKVSYDEIVKIMTEKW